MKKIIKKWLGIDKIEQRQEQLRQMYAFWVDNDKKMQKFKKELLKSS